MMTTVTDPAASFTYQTDILMRDGIRLATTIFLPDDHNRHPVVLVRTAYNRRNFTYLPPLRDQGIGLIVQDCRGRYDSDGEFYPFIHEPEDGFDTLEWIGSQSWCNGSIGMFGDSYLAACQFLAAPMGSRYLRALNPRFMAGDCWKRAYYCDGAFSLALTWSWLCFETAGKVSQAERMNSLDIPALLRHLPTLTLDEAGGSGIVGFYRDYAGHAAYDAHWEAINFRRNLGRYDMPVLLTGGWYDFYAGETLANFSGLIEKAPSPELKGAHRLLIGPWTHGINATSVLGEIDFGPAALQENDATYRWLACILHGRPAADFQAAPIRLFVMGYNIWRDEYEWPLQRTQLTAFYLHDQGILAPAEPEAGESADLYIYNPEDPVPTVGGNHSVGPYNPGLYDFVKPGPYDQRVIERRSDVLVYTTDVLQTDTEVTGPVVLNLYASSSAVDTDFFAKLTDVYPDGRSMNITEGIIRARFRQDVWGEPALLEPGAITAYTLDLQATSNVFLQGHRIRLILTSSNFPLLDRNLNTGEVNGNEIRIARQMIFHDREHPSHLLLPLVPAI